MLTHLSIQNIVLLKRCEIDFARGLNVLTGETGAGKSILLDALGLVLGERSDASLVRAGEEQASVSAEFDMAGHRAVHALLAKLELPIEETLVLRRSLTRDGKSRAFVNDAPVSVGALKRIGELLVARHGQHDQRGLLDAKIHRQLIDQFGGHGTLLKKSSATFDSYKATLNALEELRTAKSAGAGEEEWLRHMVSELDKLAPREGEEVELVEIRQKANAAKSSVSQLQQALDVIHAQEGLAPALRQAARAVGKAKWEGEGDPLSPIHAALERAETELEEATVALEKLVEAADIDPQALEHAEDRLHALRAAARKYNTHADGLAELLERSQQKLKQLTSFDAEEAKLTAALETARAEYVKAGEALSQARSKAGAALAKTVAKELTSLKMASTQLRLVQSPLPEAQWGEAGHESVVMEVAANAGMGFGALSKVASGGELSRLLLALKVVLKADDEVSAIFDEIDTGTGGAVAEAIGQRLKKLAEQAQVIVVTHLPQVAAQAAHHLFISKSGAKQTETNVVTLDAAARTEELARMLSGATISDEARKAAGKLLQAAS